MKSIYWFMAVTMLAHLPFSGSRMVVALLALELGASAFTVGLLITLFGLLPVLFSVRWGRWSDRVGVRMPMLAGTATLIAATLAGFALHNLAALFLVALVVGAGYNLFFVAQQQLMGKLGRPDQLATNLSLGSLSFSISSFIGPFITGYAIDHAGAGNAFGLLALFAACGCALIWAKPKIFPGALARAAAATTAAATPRPRVMDLLRQPELRRVYIVAVLSQTVWDTFTAIMPIYGKAHGLSASQIGAVLGTFALFTVVIRLLLPMISRRLHAWQLLIVSLAGSGLSYLGIPMVDGVPPLLLLAGGLGLAVGLAVPMLLVLLHQASPPDRVGEAIGLRVTLINGSQTLIPVAAGGAVSLLGLTGMFWMFAAVFSAGAWINRRSWKSPRAAEAASQ